MAYTLLYFIAPFTAIVLLGVVGIIPFGHALISGVAFSVVYAFGAVLLRGYPPAKNVK